MALRGALLIASLLVPLGIGQTQAKNAGDNVVVIDVAKVSLPKSLPGECRVSGIIQQVRRGAAFHAGQSLSIAVPCGSEAHLDSGPRTSSPQPFLQDVEVLMKSKAGVARLTDSGELIWQTTDTQSFGMLGAPVGYRVLDGVTLPIGKPV